LEINSIKQIKFLLSRLRCNDVECCDCAKAIDCHSLYKKYLASETNEVIELSPEDETALDNLGDSVFKTGEEWDSFYKDKIKKTEPFIDKTQNSNDNILDSKLLFVRLLLENKRYKIFICHSCNSVGRKPCITIADKKPFDCAFCIHGEFLSEWFTLAEFLEK